MTKRRSSPSDKPRKSANRDEAFAGGNHVPGATATRAPFPPTGASMRCSIFIASSTTSDVRSSTACALRTATATILPGIGAMTVPSPPFVARTSASARGGARRSVTAWIVRVDERHLTRNVAGYRSQRRPRSASPRKRTAAFADSRLERDPDRADAPRCTVAKRRCCRAAGPHRHPQLRWPPTNLPAKHARSRNWSWSRRHRTPSRAMSIAAAEDWFARRRSRARRARMQSRRIAASRDPPHAMIFASIESYQTPISLPLAIPAVDADARPSGATQRAIVPLDGKYVDGSSAFSRTSIAQPRGESRACVERSGSPLAIRSCSCTRSTP